MSKLNYIRILILSFVWINFSCEDLLDKTPQDRLHPTVYFKTEEELKLFTNQFYNQLIPSAANIYNETADIIVPSTLMNEMTGQRVIPDEVEVGGSRPCETSIFIYNTPISAMTRLCATNMTEWLGFSEHSSILIK